MLCASSMHFNVTHIERINVRSVQDLIEDGSLGSYMRPSHPAKSISHFVDRKVCDDIVAYESASAEWFVYAPRMTPLMGSPSASASSNLLRITVPTASALQ